MLERRGLKVHRFLPASRMLVHPDLTERSIEHLYRLLHRYSFRLLLRDVIRMREGFYPEDLTSYCSLRAARGYLTSLRNMGLVRSLPNNGWSLTRPTVTSFGETLEWFVARILEREFYAETIHSVSFRTPPPGGDFDVIACLEGLLVYVEVKSSPPRGIEADEIVGFLRRSEILSPHVSLFLVDTQLRMRDKLVPIFNEFLPKMQEGIGGRLKEVERLRREIFHARHRIYLLNASRGIVSNLRCCILDYLRRGNPATALVFREDGKDREREP